MRQVVLALAAFLSARVSSINSGGAACSMCSSTLPSGQWPHPVPCFLLALLGLGAV